MRRPDGAGGRRGCGRGLIAPWRGAAARSCSEPLPPRPGAVRAAPGRGAQGHDTAAGGAGPHAPPPAPRCSAPLRRAPRRDRGATRAGWGLSAAGRCHQTGRASPWQSAPRLHRSAPTSRREEERGENCCISGGGTSLPGQAQPPALPPAPPTPAGPRQQRRSLGAPPLPPPSPVPHPLRCPPCPAPAPHPPAGPRPPAPSPLRNKRAPLKRRTGGFRQVLNGIFLLAPPSFSFLCPPKRATPSEAGGGLGSGPCPGNTAVRGHPRTGSEGSALSNDSWDQGAPKPAGQGAQISFWARSRVAPHRHRSGTARRGGHRHRGMLRAELSVLSSHY